MLLCDSSFVQCGDGTLLCKLLTRQLAAMYILILSVLPFGMSFLVSNGVPEFMLAPCWLRPCLALASQEYLAAAANGWAYSADWRQSWLA